MPTYGSVCARQSSIIVGGLLNPDNSVGDMGPRVMARRSLCVKTNDKMIILCAVSDLRYSPWLETSADAFSALDVLLTSAMRNLS